MRLKWKCVELLKYYFLRYYCLKEFLSFRIALFLKIMCMCTCKCLNHNFQLYIVWSDSFPVENKIRKNSMLIPPILSFLLNFFFNYIIQLLLKSLHWKVPLLKHFKTEEKWVLHFQFSLVRITRRVYSPLSLLGTPIFLDTVWLCIIFFSYVLDLYCCHDKLQSI